VTALRERLAAELAVKVERHGVVIWDDPEGAYAAVVQDVTPTDATLHVFDGSWFDLRRRLEKSLAGQALPTVIAYVPTKPADPDPLEELRAVGAPFRLKLPTLLKSTLKGQVTEQRIAQISRQCTTIAEAESALDGGETGLDARLIALVGDSSTVAIATALIAGLHEKDLAERDLSDVVGSSLSDAIGGSFEGLTGGELREAAFRQVALAALIESVGNLPEALAESLAPVSPAQRKTCRGVIERLQSVSALHDIYVELARAVDQQLHLGALLSWVDGLQASDLTPTIEVLALTEGQRLLEAEDYAVALGLADARLAGSWWAKPTAPDGEGVAARFRAIRALARLGVATASPVPSLGSVSAMQQWYATVGWEVDSAYRHSELIRVTSGVSHEELDDLFHRARQRYEAWLDGVLRASSEAMSAPDVPARDLQRSIHTRFVRNRPQRMAYVLVDALRYELGADLTERLRKGNADVEVVAAVATPPSITPIGMAAVLPGADTSFAVGLGAKDRLTVMVSGSVIDSVKDRVQRLEHAHGTVVDLVLDDVAQLSNKDLKKRIGAAPLILVRSTEIDSDGESDQLAASWASFDVILNLLQTAVAKLLHAGIERVVITADHGFLAVRQLGEERRIDKPATGTGEQHRRAWIGRGGTGSASTVKIPLAAFGISSDLDIIAPRGLGVFSSGGGLQFFHGGLSPQELVIPVIIAIPRDDTPEPKYRIDLVITGDKITTGIVAVTVSMTGDLFTRESRVRLQLMLGKERVGVVVGGDGFDPATETIDANVDAPRVITLQVTGNLTAGSTATLEVIDAATGVRLEAIEVDVTANVLVDDDLD
jgi:hypothetical protein